LLAPLGCPRYYATVPSGVHPPEPQGQELLVQT
jgi:hypothetical protein